MINNPGPTPPHTDETPLLRVENVRKYFYTPGGFCHPRKHVVKAVDGVSFSIGKGETLGLVGESGCGKSTLGRCILRLDEPTSGSVIFDGQRLETLSNDEMRRVTQRMQWVFQDPFASLNPRMLVRDLIKAPLDALNQNTEAEKLQRVTAALACVGMDRQYLNQYPHECSCGQRQRIGMARALVLNPAFIICGEPVSALAAPARAQALNLIKNVQRERGLTYLFISQDISTARQMCDHIAVMHLGRVVETASRDMLYTAPRHPYTKALLAAAPAPNPGYQHLRMVLKDDKTRAGDSLITGCRFRPRCPLAQEQCQETDPPLREVGSGHWVACLV